MVRADLLDAIDRALLNRKTNSFSGVQMLFVGDIFKYRNHWQ